ncbi:MAG TPA: PucR family transcriptional regulator ligand-binding domain-containing protein [Thermoleophilaceae bacterium]|jgi:purine catabolism regulator|nr:PucR family transcriptional regulator ligand-binding domain-containing protein [Thermoleophilaceae bacterium]
MLTVRGLVSEMGLELVAGEDAADAPVRWVHISELPDPTQWLSGGELLLTTGIQLETDKRQREFVRLLSGRHLAGLGFGTGFDHDELPDALVDEARELSFPVFEVPYELPFIALTEKAFTRLVNEQYEVLQRGIAIHKRLERLVLEESGLDEVVRALAAATGGAVSVLSGRGETISSKAFRRQLPRAAMEHVREEVVRRSEQLSNGSTRAVENVEFAPDHPDIAGRSLVLPVSLRGRGAPQAWLVAARDTGGLGDFERLILQQAVTVVALELMRQRAMRDTERRLAGDVLAEALTGRLSDEELAMRLRPFGIAENAAVLVFGGSNGAPAPQAEAELDRFLADAGVGALVATRDRLLCAVVDAAEDVDPVALAGRARDAISEEEGALRAAASRAAPVPALRRTFHEARCALEAAALANGSSPPVASYRDLGAFQLLLSLQDDDALRLYCDSVLGPLEDASGEYGDELIRSLEAFIEQNGQWERAARELYCHRHTLRYRIRRVEQLTGRDLSNARDRIEFWLALRARELVT